MADITLYEVGPRDGLQNEAIPIATADKIRLVDLLTAARLTHIEVTSFVSPRWVPQMGDGSAVLAGIARRPGVTYAALVPNLRGFEAARAAGATEVAIFAAASEAFSEKNINAGIAESLARFAPVAAAAHAAGLPLRGYVSCITDCPYAGPIPPTQTRDVTRALFDLGCREVSLGDTIGAATPATTAALLEVLLATTPPDRLAGHFHDTNGAALANIDTCLAHGLTTFDAAIAGLGGCPYAPGAPGNVATESVAAHLADLGHATGTDPDALAAASAFARTLRSA